jgi:nucleoid-associated protein YgaU
MNNPLQALVRMGVVPPVTFPPNSRYYGTGTLTYTAPGASGNGQQSVTYLARRFVPQPGAPNFSTVAQHTVKQGDRLDLIAAKYLGDPLIFWLICDANGVIRPDDLVKTPGTAINITLPQGVPGPPSA